MAPKSLMIPFKVVIVVTGIVLEKLTLYILFVYQVVPFIKKNQDIYLISPLLFTNFQNNELVDQHLQ